MTPAGFPHSDISGSTPACDSPKLFAANHVLHRLLTPRHSPCALSSLVTNLLKLLIATFSVAIRRLQGRMNLNVAEVTRSPLTLDCVVRACDSNDVLKTRFRVVVSIPFSESCFRSPVDSRRRAGILLGSPALRQESPWLVERKGIEPLTPGLQSRCSPS
jgi:hypothetical protein